MHLHRIAPHLLLRCFQHWFIFLFTVLSLDSPAEPCGFLKHRIARAACAYGYALFSWTAFATRRTARRCVSLRWFGRLRYTSLSFLRTTALVRVLCRFANALVRLHAVQPPHIERHAFAYTAFLCTLFFGRHYMHRDHRHCRHCLLFPHAALPLTTGCTTALHI